MSFYDVQLKNTVRIAPHEKKFIGFATQGIKKGIVHKLFNGYNLEACQAYTALKVNENEKEQN